MSLTVESFIQEAAALDPAVIEASVAGAEIALKASRVRKEATVSTLEERRQRRDRWATKGSNLRTEAAAEQVAEAAKLLKNTSRANLTEAANAIGAAANVQAVIANVISQSDEAVHAAELADRSAAIALKMSERDYYRAAGLKSAAEAAIAWEPLLRLEPNTQINLEGSRIEAFVKAVLETENELATMSAERKPQ